MAEARKLNIEVAFKDSLSRPLTKTERTLAAFGQLAKGSFSLLTKSIFNVKTALASLLAAYSVNAIAERTDAMLKLAEATGDNVESISELAAVFSQNNVDFESFQVLIKNIAKAQREAVEGSREQAAAFELLGLGIEELSGLAPAQLFERIAEGLEKYEGASSKLLLLSKLLPKDSLKAFATVGKGTVELQQQILRVRQLGATVTAEQAKAADAWGDAIGEIKIAAEGVVKEFVVAFGPRIIAGLQGIATWIAQNKEVIIAVVRRIGEITLATIKAIITGIIELIGLVERLSGTKFIDEQAVRQDLGVLQEQKQVLEQIREARLAGKEPAEVITSSAGERMLPALNEDIATLSQRLDDVTQRIRDAQLQLSVGLSGSLRTNFKELQEKWEMAARDIEADAAQAGKAVSSAFAGAATKQALTEFGAVASNVINKLSQAAGAAAARVRSVFKGTTEDQKKLAAALQKTAADLDETEERMKRQGETPNTVAAGFEKRMEGLTDSARNFSRTVGEGFADLALSGIDRFSDAIANVIMGTMSAKEAFKEFAKAVLADIAKMIAKFIALGVVKTIFGLEDGGVVPGGVDQTLPIKGYAKGGIARRPQLAVFGEGRTAEAFVPLPDNRSIPVTFTGNQDNGGVVNVNITAMDSKDVTRVLTEQQGLLKTLWINQSERNVQMRQSVRKAAS